MHTCKIRRKIYSNGEFNCNLGDRCQENINVNQPNKDYPFGCMACVHIGMCAQIYECRWVFTCEGVHLEGRRQPQMLVSSFHHLWNQSLSELEASRVLLSLFPISWEWWDCRIVLLHPDFTRFLNSGPHASMGPNLLTEPSL